MKSGEWEEYKNTFRKEVRVLELAFDRIKEAFEKVAKDEARMLSTVQITSDGSSRQWQGGVTMSCLCPHCDSFPMEDHVWWSLGEKGATIGGARLVVTSTTGSNQTGSWWCKRVKVVIRDKIFRAHAVPQGLCANLNNALKLLANQQEGGDVASYRTP